MKDELDPDENDDGFNREPVTFRLTRRTLMIAGGGLIALIIVIFVIGMAIGRGKSDKPPAVAMEIPPPTQQGPEEGTAVPDGSVIRKEDALAQPQEAAPPIEKGPVKYTFYDTLEKPSGNQPPQQAKDQAPMTPPPSQAPAAVQNAVPPQPAPMDQPKADVSDKPTQGYSPKGSPAPPPLPDNEKKRFAYTVQVAAFGEIGAAEGLKDRLLAKGFAAYVAQTTVENRVLYRVRVGRFGDKAGAESIAKAIRDREKLDTFVDISYE